MSGRITTYRENHCYIRGSDGLSYIARPNCLAVGEEWEALSLGSRVQFTVRPKPAEVKACPTEDLALIREN